MAKHSQEKQDKPEGKKGKGGSKAAKAHLFLGHGKTRTPKGQRTKRSWLRPEIATEKAVPPMSDFESIPDGSDDKGNPKFVHVYLPTGEAFSEKEYDELRKSRSFNLRLAASATRPANPSA